MKAAAILLVVTLALFAIMEVSAAPGAVAGEEAQKDADAGSVRVRRAFDKEKNTCSDDTDCASLGKDYICTIESQGHCQKQGAGR